MKRSCRNVENAVDDILWLIRSGRTQMAITVLSRFVAFLDDIHEEICEQSYQEGYAGGQRDLAREITGASKPKRSRTPRRHEWLRARIADPQLRERAKAVLRLDDALLDAIAEGGVGLGSSSWRKLREALGR
jgi:hypothetical protein